MLDKKKAYINESYGAEASKAGEEALNIAKNELDVQKKLAEARLSAGSSIGSHSQGYRMWKGSYKWEGQNWRDVAGEISREYGVTFNEMKDMINMSPEVLQSIRENYAGLWSVMDGEFRNHLENIIKYGETEKEILACWMSRERCWALRTWAVPWYSISFPKRSRGSTITPPSAAIWAAASLRC